MSKRTQGKSSDAAEIPLSGWRRKSGEGASRGKKMLKDDERCRNVYENKQKIDNFTEAKGDIFARMTTFDTKVYAFDRNRRAFDMVGALNNEPRTSKGRISRKDAKAQRLAKNNLFLCALCAFASLREMLLLVLVRSFFII